MTEDMGPEGFLWLTVGGQKLSVRANSSALPKVGSTLTADIDQDLMSLFPADSGVRIIAL